MTGRPKVVAAVMLLLAFGVGGMTGMVLEEALGLDWFDFLDEDNEPERGQILAGLDLSASQRARIESILEAQEEELEDFWRSRVPEMRPIVVRSYDRIRGILSPEQRAIFDQRVEAQGILVPRDPD